MSLVRKDRHGDPGVGHSVGAAVFRGRAHGHPDHATLQAGQLPGPARPNARRAPSGHLAPRGPPAPAPEQHARAGEVREAADAPRH